MSQTQIKLKTTLSAFEELHRIADVPRFIWVEIHRIDWNNLTDDHTAMWDAVSHNSLVAERQYRHIIYRGDISPELIKSKRVNSKMVEIDKKALLHILIDHSVLYGICEELGWLKESST